MSNLIEIKKRISSITSTIKVTKVMQMIATAKIAKIKQIINVADRYESTAFSILEKYIKNTENLDKISSIIYEDKNEAEHKNILLILMSSDKGTCGSINTNIFKEFSLFFEKYNKHHTIYVLPIGKKAKKYLEANSTKYPVNNFISENEIIMSENQEQKTIELALNSIIEKYKNTLVTDRIDSIYIMYNKFKNIITCNPVCEQILPFTEKLNINESISDIVNISETESICRSIVNIIIKTSFYNAYVSNLASIISSRMNSMDNATKNGQEIIDELRIKYNKGRQTNITSELSDIVSGFEAIN